MSAPIAEPIEIWEFLPAHYDGVVALWRSSEGVVMRDADERGPLSTYLEQHRGLSFIAMQDDVVVGAVLCGTDGRRGYLQHVAVAPSHRRRGIGKSLVNASVRALAERGIDKCHLMVLANNTDAQAFWSRLGWKDRSDIRLMSHTMSGKSNA